MQSPRLWSCVTRSTHIGDDAHFRFREGLETKDRLLEFMKEQVVERKAYVNAGGVVQASDAFSMLVEASENEEAKYKMDDTELVSTCI